MSLDRENINNLVSKIEGKAAEKEANYAAGMRAAAHISERYLCELLEDEDDELGDESASDLK